MHWEMRYMKFKLTINDMEYLADMIDSDLVEQLAALCPFEANYKSYQQHEYFTKLPGELNDDGCQLTTKAVKNKLYFFKKWNSFAIAFDDANISPNSLVHIGDFEEDVSEYLNTRGRNVHVLCEVDSS